MLMCNIYQTDSKNIACRKAYLDFMRVIATLAVILCHVTSKSWNNTSVYTAEWVVINAFDSCTRWCVPIFVMISGSLFLGKNRTIKRMYSKYILRMVTSFIVWSMIYAIFFDGTLKQKFAIFFQGQYHMWYILMTIGLYACTPILDYIVKDRSINKYYLILAFAFSFFLPSFITLSNDFGNGFINRSIQIFSSSISKIDVQIILGYGSYFVLGYYLDNIVIKKKMRVILYILGIIGFVSTVVLSSIVSQRNGLPSENYYGYFSINVLLEAVAVFVIFKYKKQSRKYKKHSRKINHIALTLSHYSYGTYLVHVLIIQLFEAVNGFILFSISPSLNVLIMWAIISVVSFLISAMLNCIPRLNKFIV